MQASNVSSLLFNKLSFSAERQKAISGNIANINTPNYKTKDVVFEDELKMAKTKNDLQLKTTHGNHISIENDFSNKTSTSMIEVQGLEEQNDGNNVSLDKQMSEMSKNAVEAQALASAIKKDSRWFKSVIESSAKN